MKMESDYEPITGTLQLQYDAQAQKIFDEASKKMAPRFDFSSSPIRKMMGEEADEDIGKPLRLLAELGASSSRTIQVRPMAMQSLLNLTCWMALRLSDDQQPIKIYTPDQMQRLLDAAWGMASPGAAPMAFSGFGYIRAEESCRTDPDDPARCDPLHAGQQTLQLRGIARLPTGLASPLGLPRV